MVKWIAKCNLGKIMCTPKLPSTTLLLEPHKLQQFFYTRKSTLKLKFKCSRCPYVVNRKRKLLILTWIWKAPCSKGSPSLNLISSHGLPYPEILKMFPCSVRDQSAPINFANKFERKTFLIIRKWQKLNRNFILFYFYFT